VADSELTRAGRWRLPAGRRAGLAMTALCGVVGLFVAACSSGGSPTAGSGRQAQQPGASPAAAAARISITPGNGMRNAKPDRGVTVSVAHGKVTHVTLTAGHDPVSGVLSSGGTVWRTRWALHPSTRYHVTATAVGPDGKTTTATSSFRTLNPPATFTAQTIEGYHQAYGVAMPIKIDFNSPVTHRAAVEKALVVKTSKPVVGAWAWVNCSEAVTCLDFRPRTYWPQHTKISFTGHFNGLEIAHGVYGTANLSQSFSIGNSLIGVTSTRTHRTKIYYKNKLHGVWTDSSGMPGDDTSDGTYVTIDKGNPVYMSGPGYHHVPVNWSVRFTWSGDYYHSAPWSLGSQGFANVSHGCVNLSPTHAEWYYQHELEGSPITITGSPVAGQWGDGYTDWFWTFKQVLAHSATHMAVKAGPSGSKLVDPSSLPPASGTKSALHNSKPYNYLAKR
jgi:lipoprotein-anchoring transpeptidase ErfK/SrfK